LSDTAFDLIVCQFGAAGVVTAAHGAISGSARWVVHEATLPKVAGYFARHSGPPARHAAATADPATTDGEAAAAGTSIVSHAGSAIEAAASRIAADA